MDEVFTDPQFFYADNKNLMNFHRLLWLLWTRTDTYAVFTAVAARRGSVFNRATQARRQPGSAIKPILVYGPGIDSKTITAATVVDDVNNTFFTTSPTLNGRKMLRRSTMVLQPPVWVCTNHEMSLLHCC